MLKAYRYYVLVLVLICLPIAAAGCKGNDPSKQPTTEKTSMEQGQIEEIHPAASGLKDIIKYDLIGVRNGVFYGMGYGPSGDGNCTNAFYTLASDGSGSVIKSKQEDAYLSMERVEYPEGSGIWYVLQDVDGGTLNRIDYNTMQDETLLINKLDPALRKTIGIGTPFTVDGKSLYYEVDSEIFHQSFSDGKIEKLGKAQQSMDGTQMLFIGDQLYIQDGDSCYSLNPSDGSQQKCFDGAILGKSGTVIYFTQNKGHTETNVFSYDTKDRHTTQLIHTSHFGAVSMQDNQYIIVYLDNRILALNLKKNRIYDVNTAAVTKILGQSADFWYADDKYLYAQSVCNWDLGETLPDRFYRWAWK